MSNEINFTFERPQEYLKTKVTGQYMLAALALKTHLRDLRGTINHYLDFGCGAGKSTWPVLDDINENGIVTGVDISEDMLALARRESSYYGPLHTNITFDFKLLSIRNGQEIIPIPTGTVDVVGSSIVFQEIKEIALLESVFSEINRVLKPGGHFIAICVSDKITNQDFTSFTYAYSENQNRPDQFRRCRAVGIDIVWEDDYHWPQEVFVEALYANRFMEVEVEYISPLPGSCPYPEEPEIMWKDELIVSPLMSIRCQKM